MGATGLNTGVAHRRPWPHGAPGAVDGASAPVAEATVSALEAPAPDRPVDRQTLAARVADKRPALIGYLCNHVHDEQLAEDLAQDVLVRALANLDEIDGDRSLWPWLMIIARNRLIDHFRRAATADGATDDPRVSEAMTPGGSPSEMSDFADPATRYEERELLEFALRPLGRRQRSALLLHDAQDWTSDQLAELYGRDRNAIHQLLHRARATARKEYLRLTRDGGPRALVPLPLVWLGDVVRRAWMRTKHTLQQASPTLPMGSESVGGLMMATVVIGTGLLVATGAPPQPEAVADRDRAVPTGEAEQAAPGHLPAATSARPASFASTPTAGDMARVGGGSDGSEAAPAASVAAAAEGILDAEVATPLPEADATLGGVCSQLLLTSSCALPSADTPGMSGLTQLVLADTERAGLDDQADDTTPGTDDARLEDTTPDEATGDVGDDESSVGETSEDEAALALEPEEAPAQEEPTADGIAAEGAADTDEDSVEQPASETHTGDEGDGAPVDDVAEQGTDADQDEAPVDEDCDGVAAATCELTAL